MAERILATAYRDEWAETPYPFGDTATLVATDRSALLDRDVFLDASLYPVGNSGSLYLSQIVVTAREVTFRVAGPDRKVLATGSFDPVFPDELVELLDAYGRPAGVLVSDPDRLARFAAWPAATYAYEPEATPFAARCVIPFSPPGVQGILLDTDELLTGDVWLVGDNGVVVREEEGDIRVDIVGDPLFVRKLCLAVDRFVAPRLLRQIGDCGPDRYGGFLFVPAESSAGRPALRIYPNADGALVFELAGANDGGACGN